ncbi:MAG: SAM-dependent methyltransferase [Burkholderiales bacterium]
MPATLYLVPSVLGDGAPIQTLPAATLAILQRLDHLVVETPKQARRFLKLAGVALADRPLHIEVLDEHTPESRLPALLAPALAGSDLGIVSDAGCPGVADPGARLVRLAHAHAVRVVPLVGPSSILLALMASGLNGQRFVFHGYLPVEAARRDRTVRTLELAARRRQETQIMIEAPYRNNRLLQALLGVCAPGSLLCLAADVTLASEWIVTRTIAQWRADCPDIDRRPTVFLLGAETSSGAAAHCI